MPQERSTQDDAQLAEIQRVEASSHMTVVDDLVLSNGCRVVLTRHDYDDSGSGHHTERVTVFRADGQMTTSSTVDQQFGAFPSRASASQEPQA